MKTARAEVAIFMAVATFMVFSGCYVNLANAEALGPPNMLGPQSSSSDIGEQEPSTPQQLNFSSSTLTVFAVVMLSIITTVLLMYVVSRQSETET